MIWCLQAAKGYFIGFSELLKGILEVFSVISNIVENSLQQLSTYVFRNGSLNGGKVDLVLSCVDNFEARMTINTVFVNF